MGHVAPECAQRRSARPDGLADVRVLERTLRVLRQRQPETVLVGTGGHIVDEGVVRVGDPVSRHRVVRRQQGVLAGQAGLPDGLAILVRELSPFAARLVGHAGLGRMALDLDGEVPDELVAVLDAVFEEEAVTDDVVGHVVLDAQVVRAVHGHAAVVGVVDGGVLDVLALARRRPDASGSDSGPASCAGPCD